MRKENKFVQTDLGKYGNADSLTYKDSTKYLQRELEDAERLIQQHKGESADYNHDVVGLELQLKKAKMEKDEEIIFVVGSDGSARGNMVGLKARIESK